MVPVVKDADRKGIIELSKEFGDISKKARDGKLSPGDMQGGTFTISSLGGIGGTSFTPIVNAPEVAILGVVRSKMSPVWNGSEFVPRLMLPVSLSYDHRVIDGALAARLPGSCAICSKTTAGSSFRDARKPNMSAVEIPVPDIGDFGDVPVIEIHVSPGDVVAIDDPLVTLESDKATMDVPSPSAGTVSELRVAVGDTFRREVCSWSWRLRGHRACRPRNTCTKARIRIPARRPVTAQRAGCTTRSK